ncbi:MAG: DUF3297 family protein [Pseudomonadota bacterium]|nr:DUF3297 family protein [Pseudomonadota bacterium]
MADQKKSLPDRLSLNPRSEYFDQDVLSQGVGIRFNGIEKTNVVEYSVSEGWICVPAGRSLDRFGQPMTVKLKGKVEPYYEGDEAAAETSAAGNDEKGPGENAEA